jgi:ribokinase
MIIVFGSNVLDLFFDRPDLPARDTAVFLDSHVEAAGGKGANQAVAAAAAESEVRFFGALGDGGHGRQMYKNLARRGVDVSGITFLDEPSGLACIFVDKTDGTHRIVVSQGANLLARQDTIPDQLLVEDAVLLLQGELPMAETEALIVRAKARGARCVMNFAPATQDLSQQVLRNLDVLIVNRHEADLLQDKQGFVADDMRDFVRIVYERFGLDSVVTMGAEGCVACCGGAVMHVTSLPIDPVDTVGAGDAQAGFFAAALEQGEDFKTALRWGAVAGALACTQMGAQAAVPTRVDVLARCGEITVEVV